MLFNVGDTRATPMANEQRQTSVIGACTHCWAMGYRCACSVDPAAQAGGYTFYVTAFSRLEAVEQERLRPLYEASFGRVPQAFRDLIFRTSEPPLKTHAEIVAAGLAAEKKPSAARTTGYNARDAFATHYPGVWDSSRQFMNCTAHAVGNLVGSLFGCVGRVGASRFTTKRKAVESRLGRLEYLAGTRKAEWEAEQLAKHTRLGTQRSRSRQVDIRNVHSRSPFPLHLLPFRLFLSYFRLFPTFLGCFIVAHAYSAIRWHAKCRNSLSESCW